jgi:MFS family permease
MALKLLGKDGFYGWVNLAVMFFFNIAMMPMLLAFSFFLTSWKDELGWTSGMASGAQMLSSILMGFAAPLVGSFIMKRGAKRAIVIGNLINVAGLVLLANQHHIWQLYLGLGVFLGLGLSLGGMLAGMTVINNWFVMKRTMALSISMASMGLSGVIINPSIQALIITVGWRKSYLLLAAVVLLFCVIVPALLLKNRPEDLGQVPDGPASARPDAMGPRAPAYKHLYKTPVDFTAREAFRTPALWLLMVYGALQFLVMLGAGAYTLDFQIAIGISRMKAGFIASVFSAIMLISQLGIGFLGLRFKMHSMAVVSMIMGMIGFAFLAFGYSVPMMLGYAVIYGLAGGIQSIAMGNLFPDYFGRKEFPKIMGYTMPFNTLVSSLGAPLAGIIHDKTGSYVPAFRLFLVLLAISFFCILFAKPPLHPSLKNKTQEKVAEPQPV